MDASRSPKARAAPSLGRFPPDRDRQVANNDDILRLLVANQADIRVQSRQAETKDRTLLRSDDCLESSLLSVVPSAPKARLVWEGALSGRDSPRAVSSPECGVRLLAEQPARSASSTKYLLQS
jgi:hypothetical protein